MFEYDNTLILFGRSPFINEIAKQIPLLCKKYHTMGCNYFCETFPEVEYVIFYDDIVPHVKPHHKIITNIKYWQYSKYKCHKLLEGHANKSVYIINKKDDCFTENSLKLNFCIHTPSMALNWAYLKGFKNVIIAGIDLTLENNEHFDKNSTPDRDGHDFNTIAIKKARDHLENVSRRYLNVYQLNPNNDIKIPKVRIEDLL